MNLSTREDVQRTANRITDVSQYSNPFSSYTGVQESTRFSKEMKVLDSGRAFHNPGYQRDSKKKNYNEIIKEMKSSMASRDSGEMPFSIKK
jgi:hypothetical protein